MPSDIWKFLEDRRLSILLLSVGFLLGVLWVGQAKASGAEVRGQSRDRPNILFIIIDDHAANMVSVLNESVVQTPTMESLAERGAWFTHAYNDAPACGPSRTAFLTGVQASKSGVYHNNHGFRRTKRPISEAETLHGLFLRNGYLTAGYGKITHTAFQTDNLDDFTPGYRVLHRDKKLVTHQREELAKKILPGTLRIPDPEYMPTRFGMLPDDWDRDDPGKMQEDTETANRSIAFLEEKHDQPFFLTCGFYRPHSERVVAKRYYDLYPLEEMEIPASYKADDLEDVPERGRWMATRLGTHAAVINAGLWMEYLRSYYAATTYIDEQAGRVLKALAASPYAGNTIIVFASDNGYSAGEKNLWSKFALWDQTCRVALAIVVPGIEPRLINTPVSLIDLYPTLLDLCSLPAPTKQQLDGINLVPLLTGERSERGKPVLTTNGPGNHSITDGRFRYIRYQDGGEELYDHRGDPHEWYNQADNPKLEAVKSRLAGALPENDVPPIESGRKSKPKQKTEKPSLAEEGSQAG